LYLLCYFSFSNRGSFIFPTIFCVTLHSAANYAVDITSDNTHCSMCRKRVTANLVQVPETFKRDNYARCRK